MRRLTDPLMYMLHTMQCNTSEQMPSGHVKKAQLYPPMGTGLYLSDCGVSKLTHEQPLQVRELAGHMCHSDNPFGCWVITLGVAARESQGRSPTPAA